MSSHSNAFSTSAEDIKKTGLASSRWNPENFVNHEATQSFATIKTPLMVEDTANGTDTIAETACSPMKVIRVENPIGKESKTAKSTIDPATNHPGECQNAEELREIDTASLLLGALPPAARFDNSHSMSGSRFYSSSSPHVNNHHGMSGSRFFNAAPELDDSLTNLGSGSHTPQPNRGRVNRGNRGYRDRGNRGSRRWLERFFGTGKASCGILRKYFARIRLARCLGAQLIPLDYPVSAPWKWNRNWKT